MQACRTRKVCANPTDCINGRKMVVADARSTPERYSIVQLGSTGGRHAGDSIQKRGLILPLSTEETAGRHRRGARHGKHSRCALDNVGGWRRALRSARTAMAES